MSNKVFMGIQLSEEEAINEETFKELVGDNYHEDILINEEGVSLKDNEVPLSAAIVGSSLVSHVNLSPNVRSGVRRPITKITPHHAAGVLHVENLCAIFKPASRGASCTYAIGLDGRIGQVLSEDKSPITSSCGGKNDNEAITFELSNSTLGPNWEISDVVFAKFIDLCVDICQRNPEIKQKDGSSGLNFDGTANGSLTFHSMFAATNCPGPSLLKRMQEICTLVNGRLDAAKIPQGQYPVSKQNVQAMFDLGIVSSPGYWEAKTDIQYLDGLMTKVASTGFGNKNINNNISDPIVAINILVAAGAISSAEYWIGLVEKSVDPYISSLLRNMANKISLVNLVLK